MKKFYTIAAIVATTFLYAQETETEEKVKSNTLSVHGSYGEPGQIGLSYELYDAGFSRNDGAVINLSYGFMSLDTDGGIENISGTGFVIELGNRSYWNDTKDSFGFYTANYLSYGNIKFDENIDPFGTFEGTYSYFSFFSPEVGYKIKAGNFVIDPFIGGMWKIEIKGKGDVDNNYIDEWAMRAGLKLGYNF